MARVSARQKAYIEAVERGTNIAVLRRDFPDLYSALGTKKSKLTDVPARGPIRFASGATGTGPAPGDSGASRSALIDLRQQSVDDNRQRTIASAQERIRKKIREPGTFAEAAVGTKRITDVKKLRRGAAPARKKTKRAAPNTALLKMLPGVTDGMLSKMTNKQKVALIQRLKNSAVGGTR